MVTADTLMRQAPATIQLYLSEAVQMIDSQFQHTGYAQRHPELVSAFIRACAVDFATAIYIDKIDSLIDAISQINVED